ncbi:otoconin-90-like, partial [Galendromus occidentalis]|uniref:Phospholipase A2 n=1 Tax=Galendromus occidentalis TaxID=34638 RepID=A0AAJ6VVJ6_9ACAR
MLALAKARRALRLLLSWVKLQVFEQEHRERGKSFNNLEEHLYRNESRNIIIADVPFQRKLTRKKRSVLQLASMLKCVTGCSPLAFHGYGCFCGYMGDGSPVDPIDSCCLEHDWCYSSTHCSHVATYFLPYDWHCGSHGYAYCDFTGSASPHASCAQQLCACDAAFAKCISKYPCPVRRANCRQGRSLIRSIFGYSIMSTLEEASLPASLHKVEKIRKLKTKLSLTAGIHEDPWTKLPALHVKAEVDQTELTASSKKLPEDPSIVV